MSYVVCHGRLEYRARYGNGPAKRSSAGMPCRRVINGIHATKGRREPLPAAGTPFSVPDALIIRRPADAAARRREVAQRNLPRASVPGSIRRAAARVNVTVRGCRIVRMRSVRVVIFDGE